MLLAGCSSHEALPPSGPKQPTSPDQVKLYQKHPKKYEQLGAVSLPVSKQSMDERGDATAVFEVMKGKAAALGANGLLLVAEPPPGDMYQVTASYRGTFYRVPVQREPRTAYAQAIFVLVEE